jgi:DNA replication protein DnaC
MLTNTTEAKHSHSELQLINTVKALKLTGMLDSLEGRLQQARNSSLSYEELLAMLFNDELEHIEREALQKRIENARFEELKSFESFDINRYTPQIKNAISHLITGKFIQDKNHVIIMGPVGTGKTHLSQALGMIACQKRKRVKFVVTNELLSEFHRARADETHNKLLKRFTKFDMIILDDFGLKPLSAEQSADLYDLIAATHIRASLVITTNRKIEKWMELFFDPVMANAALDRIVNKAYRIVLDGESYRKNFIPKIQMEDDKMKKED